MTENENYNKNEPMRFMVDNAGLCFFSPWYLRLFSMLDYLNEDRRDFKDDESRIRAIFLLQYLTCLEEKEYEKTDLMFNRVLVSLPIQIPLPKSLALSNEEKQTADSMLEGVKSNWSKMNGTSIKGFQQSFIFRTGHLEQQDEKWLLTVESRTVDILLDTVPWSFKQIRFPWLKKYVQVIWHENHEF